MKKTSKPILFFGTEDFSTRYLEALIADGYDIRAVVTKPDSPRGRGHKLTSPLVKQTADSHGIDVWQPNKLSDIEESIRQIGDVAAVLVSYGKIIPSSIINLFTPGIINVHPSLLPKYRGPSPIESAIANGDRETGVSIMKLEAAMDAGPVYSQIRVALTGKETKPSLYESLGATGVTELLKQLPDILDSTLPPVPQDESSATYCQLLTKQDGRIDPATISAHKAEAMVRAYLGFPKTRIDLLGRSVIVTKAHVTEQTETPPSPLTVRCSDGLYLSIDELIAPSGKLMSGESFLRGYAA